MKLYVNVWSFEPNKTRRSWQVKLQKWWFCKMIGTWNVLLVSLVHCMHVFETTYCLSRCFSHIFFVFFHNQSVVSLASQEAYGVKTTPTPSWKPLNLGNWLWDQGKKTGTFRLQGKTWGFRHCSLWLGLRAQRDRLICWFLLKFSMSFSETHTPCTYCEAVCVGLWPKNATFWYYVLRQTEFQHVTGEECKIWSDCLTIKISYFGTWKHSNHQQFWCFFCFKGGLIR